MAVSSAVPKMPARPGRNRHSGPAGPGGEELRSSGGEYSAGNIGDLREGDLLRVACRVDALHRLQRLLARNEILLGVLGYGDGGAENGDQADNAEAQDRDGDHGFNQRESVLPGYMRSALRHCCTHVLTPLWLLSRQPRTLPVVPKRETAREL